MKLTKRKIAKNQLTKIWLIIKENQKGVNLGN